MLTTKRKKEIDLIIKKHLEGKEIVKIIVIIVV